MAPGFQGKKREEEEIMIKQNSCWRKVGEGATASYGHEWRRGSLLTIALHNG